MAKRTDSAKTADPSPILNGPYDPPAWHYATPENGSLDYELPLPGRRIFATQTPQVRPASVVMDIPRDLETQRAVWLRATDAPFLQGQAGASVYARGESYALGGAVDALSISFTDDELRAQACISGTQDYAVHWRVGRDGAVTADCDCPHAQDGYFCKHQVALGLTLHALLVGETLATDDAAQKKIAAAAKRAQTQAASQAALRAFLQQHSKQTLADWLWRQAEGDRALMSALKAWAAVSRSGDDWPAIKAAITASVPPARGFLDWRGASAYARQVEPVLTLLRRHAKSNPALGRQACEHALLRLYKAAEEADDSNGDLGGLVEQVMDLLVDTLRAAPPPAEWVDRWFDLMAADPWGLWHEPDVLQAAGEAVRQRHAQRVAQDWHRWLAKNPASAQAARASRYVISSDDIERMTLRRRYLAVLQAQGDVQAVIDALLASAGSAGEWCELIEFCDAHGRQREGFQHALEGVKRFPGDPQCERMLLQAYERDGWDAEALALRRRQFERHPWRAEDYDALLRVAQAAGHDRTAYRNELYGWAEQREQAESGCGPRHARDVSLRVSWLLHEKRDQDALALVQPPHICRDDLLCELAKRLPKAQQNDAVVLLKRVFDAAMLAAQSPYTRPLALVHDIARRQPSSGFRPWLAWLRATYKAKRNFIKGLPE